VQDMTELTSKGMEMIMIYAPKLVLAILTLLLGLSIIKGIIHLISKSLEKTHVDETLRPFISNFLSWGLKAMLFISVASMVGIATTSFIAVLGAAGLAIGLALQGSLANFAGGVLILFFKPYRVGDLIDSQGHLGVVKEVQIFNTILVSPDNKRIIVPNASLSNNAVVNYSAEGNLRVDLVVGIAYPADVTRAKEVLLEMMQSDPLVLETPEPLVAVSELADSSVNLVVRPWCKVADYWDVYFSVTEKSKSALDAAGIEIPFPQRDVHLYEHKVP